MTLDPCTCCLIIESRSQDEKALLRQAYTPFLAWIDPSFKLIKLITQPHNYKTSNKWTRHISEKIISSPPDIMTSPALSVMLFLHDTGPLSSERFQRHFATGPWKLHHRLELVNIYSPTLALAEQRFYQAECDTPLWAVCPVDQSNEHLRFNIFVRNFSAMVEFYRVITGVEMETTKDNFCWFQIYSQPGVKIRLGLKYHKCINPVPSRRSALRFKVKNINHLRDVIGTNFRQTAPGCFVVVDPDGNSVYLETGQTYVSTLTTFQLFSFQRSTEKVYKEPSEEDFKYKFQKKASESSDSGRFSDSEAGASEYKVIPQNNNLDERTFFSEAPDNQLLHKTLPTHDANTNPNSNQPYLKFKEKIGRILQKSFTKKSVMEKSVDASSKKKQLQTSGKISGEQICRVKKDEVKTILRHEGQFFATLGAREEFNTATLKHAPSPCEFGNKNTNFPPETFTLCSLSSRLESVEERTVDDGFYDQNLSESCRSVFFDDSLQKRKNMDSPISICNSIELKTSENSPETDRKSVV